MRSVFTHDDNMSAHFPSCEHILPIGGVTITREGMLVLLLNLGAKKLPGTDGILSTFLSQYGSWCSKYLTLIFGKSLSSAGIRAKWKYTKLILIPKMENQSFLTSYKPISSLCTCTEFLEHLILKRISTFLNDSAIIDTRWNGFRQGFLTVTQLVETVHDLMTALDRQS